MTRRRILFAALFAATGAAGAGCNAILDNTEGILATGSDGGDELAPAPADDGSSAEPSPLTTDAGSDAGAPGDAEGTDCTLSQHVCNGACVPIGDPTYGCSTKTCDPCSLSHATPTCKGDRCAVATCAKGWGDCNANPTDGCETDLSKATSCGACSVRCPATAPLCTPSGASFACTNGCSPAAPLLCGTECVDPTTSASHCGSCARACPAVPNATIACTAGVCSFACATGFHACGEGCAQDTDPAACGPLCVACPAAPNTVATCTAGACGAHCETGFADCNAKPADGCEVDLTSDPLHCGTCDTSCDGGECKKSVCTHSGPD